MFQRLKIKEILNNIYYSTVHKIIPKYHDRTIFTKFYWRTWWDRRTKGFDETCTWSLDYSLSKLIEPRLQMFSEYNIGIPYNYTKEVENELIAKGKKDDTQKCRFVNKKDNEYAWKEASRRWNNDIDIMRHAFADILEEEDNWEFWVNKYKPTLAKHNKKICKLKTENERKAYWDSFGFTREYHSGIEFTTYDFSNKLRRHGLELFSKYFEHLWW